MRTAWIFPALVLTAAAAAGIGFAGSYYRDAGTMRKLESDRNFALNCRRAGTTAPPCPVLYRNTRIEWRDRIQTVLKPDRRQAQRIAFLSAELADAQRMIRELERAPTRTRTIPSYGLQDGTIMHPFATAERCPSGSTVAFDTGSRAAWHSGDPNVCYVRSSLENQATLTPERR